MIAMYGLSDNNGGVEKSAFRIINNTDERFAIIIREEYAKAEYLKNSLAEVIPVSIQPGMIGYLTSFKTFYKLFKNRPDITILHYHFMSYYSLQILVAAWIRRVPKRILHIRGSGFTTKSIKGELIHLINKPVAHLLATDFLACSELAAKFAYYKRIRKQKCKVIYNGVELEKYADNCDRNNIRMQYGLSQKIVYGHVGAMLPVKNHEYLINLFSQIHKKQPNSMLLLVGDGPLHSKITEQIKQMGLQESVILTGNLKNTFKIYQAMDVLLLPSYNEGLPNVVIEAQANGLPCFVSDRVTKEVAVTDLVHWISLSDTVEITAEVIVNSIIEEKKPRFNELKKAGFHIEDTVKLIQKVYHKGENKSFRNKIDY